MMSSREPSADADVCIVGSGPAGAILADALAQRGWNVVVLEAGRRFELDERLGQMEMELRPEYGRGAVWEMGGPRDAFVSSGTHRYYLNESRVKGVGGSTLHWGALTPRLHPEDFEMRSRHGLGRDWPIGYDDLAPYYLEAEREMGVSGAPHQFAAPRDEPYPQPAFPPSYSDGLIEEACAALGIETHSAPRAINIEPYNDRGECIGFGTCDPVCPSGAKYDASIHVESAEEAGARIIDRAPVRRLVHDEGGERIVEAVYSTPDGRTHRQRATYFVAACGAVETIRLLLLSASPRHPDGLANGSGTLGRYFMEHPGITVTATLDEPTRQHLIGYSTRITEQFYEYDEGPRGTFVIELSNTAGPRPTELALDQSPASGRLARGDVESVLAGDDWGNALHEDVAERSTRKLSINAWTEQLPVSANRIGIDRSTTDTHGNPVPEVTYSIDDRTRACLGRVEDRIHDIFEELGAVDITTESGPDSPWTAKHHMGGTRMGTEPSESVVDPTLLTHELSNLYLSSSSVFVTSGAANPTLTIAALTRRLADDLHERLS